MLPQVNKIFRRKSAKDISVSSYSFLLMVIVIWVFYGYEKQDFPVIITHLIAVFSSKELLPAGFYMADDSKISERR